MKSIFAFIIKALRVGPLPYLALCVAILGLGAVLQMRGDGTAALADGRTIFGIFAQIGGCVGLVGLATMIFRGLPSVDGPDDHLPRSAREARMQAAPSPLKPSAPHPAPPQSASPAAKAGMRMARQMGSQAIRQLVRRGT